MIAGSVYSGWQGNKGNKVQDFRNGSQISEGPIASIKRLKDDVRRLPQV